MAATQALKSQVREVGYLPDIWLLTAVVALVSLGALMVFSATVSSRDGSLNSAPFLSHMSYLGISACFALMLSSIPVNLWSKLSRVLLVAVIASLVIVLLPGVGIEVNGSQRWLPLGPVHLQPSEFAKIGMIIYIADYLIRRGGDLKSFRYGIVSVALILAVVGSLLLAEPDFGSTVVIAVTVIGMMFLGGIRLTHFSLCVLVSIAGVVVLTWVSPYRMARVMSFLNPWSDPFDSGFQLSQALIAFGRGEWFGVGLGASVQKLFYLPHASNDFLLAVIGEELGFAGVLSVILLFAVVLWRAFVIADKAEKIGRLFSCRIAQGVGLLIGIQAVVNIGVNLGVLPTKGLTLPFMSYGGSSIVAMGCAVGLLFAVDRDATPNPGADR